MTRNILLAVLLAFSFSTVSMAAPADKVKADKVVVTAKKKVKKAEPKKEEAPVAYKKPTRKKVVKK